MASCIVAPRCPSFLWRSGIRYLPTKLARSFTRRAFTPADSGRIPSSNSSFREYDFRVFKVTEEIKDAVATGQPVVALESAIYTHGYPPGDMVDLALHLESLVRLNGGVPATIGILNGVARVGMGTAELIGLASTAGDARTLKVSRRDLPHIVGLGLAGKKLQGGTTISSTMILARMAGVEVFGTAGLGGVHRGGETSMDISADLTELGRTNVAVISSGFKSFLDLPRTLEYLETQGVCVSTFADGREEEHIDFPSFYSRDSGIRSPSIVHNEREAAAIIHARQLLKIKSGILFANPISVEHSIPISELETVIQTAIRDASEKGYHGSSNTPFIMAHIKACLAGKSIPATRAMIESNVKRATRVAVELSELKRSEIP